MDAKRRRWKQLGQTRWYKPAGRKVTFREWSFEQGIYMRKSRERYLKLYDEEILRQETILRCHASDEYVQEGLAKMKVLKGEFPVLNPDKWQRLSKLVPNYADKLLGLPPSSSSSSS